MIAMRVKVNYKVGDFPKYVIGILLSEDDNFFKVKSDLHGDIFHISKQSVVEFVELNGGDSRG